MSEFLATYPAKLLEYSLGAGYLMLFVPFWRYVQGKGKRPAEKPAEKPIRIPEPAYMGWFKVPDDVLLHQGHTWAREEPSGLVEVGLDDFAARLLGPVHGLTLPKPGSPVKQGGAAALVREDGKLVPLVSPVDGVVAEVNQAAADQGAWLHEPYAAWLFKVRPAHLPWDRDQLFQGDSAREYEAREAETLVRRLSPELGTLVHDGGTPIHGIARELSPEKWDELCDRYFTRT